MPYVLGLALLANAKPPIELTDEEAEKIRRAKRIVLSALNIEEHFDIVLENYAEFERSLLDIALRHSIKMDVDWFSGMDDLSLMGRRLSNLLGSTTLYLGHTRYQLKQSYGRDSVEFTTFNDRLKTLEKDGAFNTMKTLRNQSQHTGLLVHSATNEGSWDESGTWLHFRTVPKFVPAKLAKDSRTTADLRTYSETKPEPLAPLIRNYLATIGELHKVVRESTSAVTAAVSLSSETVSRGHDYFEKKHGLVLAEHTGDPSIWVSKEDLFPSPMQRLERFRQKNGSLARLSARYVSNRQD